MSCRATLSALALLAVLPGTASAAEASYFIRTINGVDECHAAYADAAGADVRNPRLFTVRRSRDGSEHAYECLADGVSEFVCNIQGGKLAVAIHPGESNAFCHARLPGLPTRHRQQWLPN